MTENATSKTNSGRFFEDFEVGEIIHHAVPRTVTSGDTSLYIALTGSRYPLHCSRQLAQAAGFEREPVNDLLVFHLVFGKTVGDISLNAVANLGYADLRFLAPVFEGDTLSARSEVLGKKENSSGKHGVVWVRTTGENQDGKTVLEYCRWVMVNKRDVETATGERVIPELPEAVAATDLVAPSFNVPAGFTRATGSTVAFEDFTIGERIDHVDGMTFEESEHALATRLYQNTAKVHFNAYAMATSRFEKRLVYGGHVISLCRALSFNGLENATGILAFNAGAHANPTFAGDTLFAYSEILDTAKLNDNFGALRVRLVGLKNKDPIELNIPRRVRVEGKERYHSAVVLDLDYWIAFPTRSALTAAH